MLEEDPARLTALSVPILLGSWEDGRTDPRVIWHGLHLGNTQRQGSIPVLFLGPLDGSSPSPKGALGTCCLQSRAELRHICLCCSWGALSASPLQGKHLCTVTEGFSHRQTPHRALLDSRGPPQHASLTQNLTRKKAF